MDFFYLFCVSTLCCIRRCYFIFGHVCFISAFLSCYEWSDRYEYCLVY